MRILTLLTIAILTTSCATGLKPSNERGFKMRKKNSKNFKQVVKFFRGNLNDPSRAIKMQDEKDGILMVDANVPCNIFRQGGDPNTYMLKFIMTAKIKNGVSDIRFDDMFIANPTGDAVIWSFNQISSPEKLEQSKRCLKPLMRGL